LRVASVNAEEVAVLAAQKEGQVAPVLGELEDVVPDSANDDGRHHARHPPEIGYARGENKTKVSLLPLRLR
jgi:hypothetical protein